MSEYNLGTRMAYLIHGHICHILEAISKRLNFFIIYFNLNNEKCVHMA